MRHHMICGTYSEHVFRTGLQCQRLTVIHFIFASEADIYDSIKLFHLLNIDNSVTKYNSFLTVTFRYPGGYDKPPQIINACSISRSFRQTLRNIRKDFAKFDEIRIHHKNA